MPTTDTYRKNVEAWRRATLAQLDASFDKLNIRHAPNSPSPHPSREILKAITAYKLGLPSKISFKFPKHMVFVHKGVGKGVPIGIAGSSATKRVPKEWFNPVVDKQIDELADIVANGTADFLIADIGIR